MRILVAPDKFKGTLSAAQAAEAIAAGLLLHDPTLAVTVQPLADGGEGTAELLTQATNGQFFTATVADPLSRSVEARYGLSGDGSTAFVEMAEASGLHRLSTFERNPLRTSTFGTGELLRAVLDRNVRTIVLCIGGSATNDGGTGLAAALGWEFRDEAGNAVEPVGGSLERIASVSDKNVDPRLRTVRILVACDVDNPLYGPNGAAPVYGPQKGADAGMVERLDHGLRQLADVVAAHSGQDLAQEPGSGAAGGTGFGARVFLKAELQSGVAIVSQYLQLEQKVRDADLILTGEGKIDSQTLSGKLIGGLTALARQQQVPVAAFCGRLALSEAEVSQLGLVAATAITPDGMRYDDAVRRAPMLLSAAAYAFIRNWVSS
ncbi:glycerate kinase [Tellurirhabdus rosea]|uniref:glycerate kinase n=1 Tax=Tellurirhabdus rosea TaxID=2674997 RepID=UPI00224FBAF2|nr:glycerate kinase [Tellurirhabdus rosea]